MATRAGVFGSVFAGDSGGAEVMGGPEISRYGLPICAHSLLAGEGPVEDMVVLTPMAGTSPYLVGPHDLVIGDSLSCVYPRCAFGVAELILEAPACSAHVLQRCWACLHKAASPEDGIAACVVEIQEYTTTEAASTRAAVLYYSFEASLLVLELRSLQRLTHVAHARFPRLSPLLHLLRCGIQLPLEVGPRLLAPLVCILANHQWRSR